jgi:hypothetical protein
MLKWLFDNSNNPTRSNSGVGLNYRAAHLPNRHHQASQSEPHSTTPAHQRYVTLLDRLPSQGKGSRSAARSMDRKRVRNLSTVRVSDFFQTSTRWYSTLNPRSCGSGRYRRVFWKTEVRKPKWSHKAKTVYRKEQHLINRPTSIQTRIVI